MTKTTLISLYSFFLLYSCSVKENNIILREISSILKNELNISKELSMIYVIQDNSCSICFENIVNYVDNHEDPNSLGVIYLSKFKKVSKQSVSFLKFKDLYENRIYVSNNTKLQDLLLKAAGGFSKGFYSIEMRESKPIKINPLD